MNLRAQALYRSEGFVEEGRLRESVRTDHGYDALVVMAMLEQEHAASVKDIQSSDVYPTNGGV